MKPIRVFPRRTLATPDDEDVRFGPPGLFDQADEVRVSVTWTWDKPRAEHLADQWRMITSNVQVGGPAYDDPGGEFTPGMFLKHGYTITSRGCPNNCWFCSVPKREGTVRELEIHDGHILQDNNILACSEDHVRRVFAMLSRQRNPIVLSGGIEAKLLQSWHVDELARLRLQSLWMAYDTADDYEPLIVASRLLREAGLIKPTSHVVSCYVLVGYRKDTIEKAEKRLTDVMHLGIRPFAMLYNKAEGREDRQVWNQFARTWANSIIVGSRMRQEATA